MMQHRSLSDLAAALGRMSSSLPGGRAYTLEAGGLERSLSVTGNFGAGSGSGTLMKGSRFAANCMLDAKGIELSVPP